MNTEAKTIVDAMNARARELEGNVPFQQILYSYAGWAGHFANELYDTTAAAIAPQLTKALYRIKNARGVVCHDDATILIDHGLMIDLRAPEDREDDPIEWVDSWDVDAVEKEAQQ